MNSKNRPVAESAERRGSTLVRLLLTTVVRSSSYLCRVRLKGHGSLPVFVILLACSCPSRGQSLEECHRQATTLREKGKFTEALPLSQRALAISEKSFGPQHQNTAATLCNLAILYQCMGDYAKALPLYERSLAIREKTLGPRHRDTAFSLNGLAHLHQAMGDYAKAVPLYERSLAIQEKTPGPQHPETAFTLNLLASLHKDMGDYAKAVPLYVRSLAIYEKSLGPADPMTAKSLADLALLYSDMGDHARALPLSERALAIFEKCLGPEHPATADGLNRLAGDYRGMGDSARALPLSERALGIREKTLGPEHPDTAFSLSNLAKNYHSMGDYARALPLFERALAILEKSFGPQHPDTATTLHDLAVAEYIQGDISSARKYAGQQIAAIQRQQQSILTLDEHSRTAWQSKNLSFWSACVLRPEPLAQLALRQKGLVLDSLLEDRSLAVYARNDPDSRAKLEEITALRAKLAKIAYDDNQKNEASRIQEQIGQIQRSLSKRANVGGRVRQNADITIDAILPALSADSALVDFIRFDDPKLKGDEAVCYGAIVTGSDGSPSFVRIDRATAIDNAIDALRSAINLGQAQEVEAQTKFLSEKLWQPISAKIPEGTKQLILCPDAKLNFLSFGTLLESIGSFVAEKYPIAYIGSGRDLARKPSGEAAKSLVVFADPVFDTSGDASSVQDMIAMRSAEADVFGAINLPPLPGTKAEAEQLKVIAAGAGWETTTTTGEEATEASVRNTQKPGVLHLATHGFYLNSFSAPAQDGTRGMSVVGLNKDQDKKQNKNGVDPMRASGVALTGAQQTLKLWSQRKAPDPETDGVLTAEEVASLNLDGTWLVTLSACETGVGEARSGEGVFGLRRAFMMAGAENLLMTLWSVADHTTASIMADFYKEALATGDAPGSLAKVQRNWLVKLREEKGLATAIREAGPFAMVMMTAPTYPPVELPPIAKLEAIDTSTSAAKIQPVGESASEPATQPTGESAEKNSSWWPF